MACEHPSNCQGSPSLHLRLHRGDLEKKVQDSLGRFEVEWNRKWEKWLHDRSKQMRDDIQKAFGFVETATLPHIVELKEAVGALNGAREETHKYYSRMHKDLKDVATELRASMSALPKQMRDDVQEVFSVVDQKLQPTVVALKEATDTLHHAREETREFFAQIRKEHKKQAAEFQNSMVQLRELKSDFTVAEARHHLDQMTEKAKCFCEAMDDARTTCIGVEKAKEFTHYVGVLHADLQSESTAVKSVALLGQECMSLRSKVAESASAISNLQESTSVAAHDMEQVQSKGNKLKSDFEGFGSVVEDFRRIKVASDHYLRYLEPFEKPQNIGEDADANILQLVYKQCTRCHQQLRALSDAGGNIKDFSAMVERLSRSLGEDDVSTARSVRDRMSTLRKYSEETECCLNAVLDDFSGNMGVKESMKQLRKNTSDVLRIMDESATQSLVETLHALGPKAHIIRDVATGLTEIQHRGQELRDVFKQVDSVSKAYLDTLKNKHDSIEKYREAFDDFLDRNDGGLACLRKVSQQASDTAKCFESIAHFAHGADTLGKMDLTNYIESIKEVDKTSREFLDQAKKGTISVVKCAGAFNEFIDQESGGLPEMKRVSRQALETINTFKMVSELHPQIEDLKNVKIAQKVRDADEALKKITQTVISETYWDRISDEIRNKVERMAAMTAERSKHIMDDATSKFEGATKNQQELLIAMKQSESLWRKASEDSSDLAKQVEKSMKEYVDQACEQLREKTGAATSGSVRDIVKTQIEKPLKDIMERKQKEHDSKEKAYLEAQLTMGEAKGSLEKAEASMTKHIGESSKSLEDVKTRVLDPLTKLAEKAESLKKFTVGGFATTLVSVAGSIPLMVSLIGGGSANTVGGNQTTVAP